MRRTALLLALLLQSSHSQMPSEAASVAVWLESVLPGYGKYAPVLISMGASTAADVTLLVPSDLPTLESKLQAVNAPVLAARKIMRAVSKIYSTKSSAALKQPSDASASSTAVLPGTRAATARARLQRPSLPTQAQQLRTRSAAPSSPTTAPDDASSLSWGFGGGMRQSCSSAVQS